MTISESIIREANRITAKNIRQAELRKVKLSPLGCEIVSFLAGTLSPEAEASYRESLALIDSNPRQATLLQAKAFALCGLEANKIYRKSKRKKH